MTRLAPAGGYEDDVALVVYHHPAPLDVSFSAESEQLASVRARLRGWLRSCDVGTRVAQDVLVAAGEAIANAIEHGHQHVPDQQVRLRAVSTTNQLRLTISDTGRWRSSPPGDRGLRGHGIALMRALMQQVSSSPGRPGPPSTSTWRSAMATPLELSTRHGGDGTLVVTAVGEIDMSNADQFRAALEAAAAAGGRFVVDLTGVGYLDSAGIHALYAVAPQIRLITSELLSPVLDISGLSGITSVREPQAQPVMRARRGRRNGLGSPVPET